MVYVPTGNATPDFWGGHRTNADETYSSSVVALDIATGRERWHFQTTHHDIWDYDVPSQPALYDVCEGGYQASDTNEDIELEENSIFSEGQLYHKSQAIEYWG